MAEHSKSFSEAVCNGAADTVGFVKPKHRDRFDENDKQVSKLIQTFHEHHRTNIYVNPEGMSEDKT